MTKKLAIITTHPIQYYAPLFQHLTKSFQIKVFYTWGQTSSSSVHDPDFGKTIKWDIPLLEGYEYQFLENYATKPGSDHFWGVVNKNLISILNDWQPNAILVFGWCFHSHLKVLRYFKGKIKIIFRGDSTLLDESAGFSLKKLARRFFLRWVYSHVDYALYAGTANKAYFLKHGLNENQLKLAPHAVDNDRFSNVDFERTALAIKWRRQLGIHDHEVIFLFAGKLEPKKDPIILLKAFQELNQKDIRLVFTGHGMLESQLKSLAAGNSQVLFLPFQNQQNMPILYRLADVFILPSKGPGETWGLAVNETMVCGTPAIVSDRCGCASDLIIPNVTGYIFRAGDQKDLLEKMQLYLSRQQLIKMGVASKHHITNFSFERFSSSLNDIFAIL
jgi:glycosyltransferase involved in cell wall biosynthesis